MRREPESKAASCNLAETRAVLVRCLDFSKIGLCRRNSMEEYHLAMVNVTSSSLVVCFCVHSVVVTPQPSKLLSAVRARLPASSRDRAAR